MHIADSTIRSAVRSAVRGAARRLERPSCGRLLTDFKDHSGRLLSEIVDTSGMTPSRYLTEALWFVDGGDTPQCRSDTVTVAFTAVGSRVVHICGTRFQRHTVQSEMIIIHELLHALGLTENPPSGAEITRQATKHCGAS